MRAGFALFSFETWRVDLEIHFTASDKVAVIFDLIRSIALNVLRVLSLTSKHGMSLLLVVLILEFIFASQIVVI